MLLKKFSNILKSLLLVAVIIAIFFLFIRSRIETQTKETQKIFGKTKIIKQKGIPVLWLNENNILISTDGSIFKYKVDENKLGDEVYKIEDEHSSLILKNSCFNKNKLFLAFERRDPEDPGWLISFSRLVDMKQNYEVKKIDSNYVIYHNFECDVFGKENRLDYMLNTNDGGYLTPWRFLLESKYHSSHESIQQVAELIKDLSVGIPKHVQLSSDYDATKSKYLWYLAKRNFDKLLDWPSKAWWVDIEKREVSEIKIPAGPWVTDYSELDHFKCFSCGCECYTNMDLYTSNGEIYAHIYGSAVKNQTEGIYHLVFNQEINSRQWQKLADGSLDYKPLISKDGCKVLYSINEEIRINSLCGNL